MKNNNMISKSQSLSWIDTCTYHKVCDEIESWPNWKKEAYNEMFTSRHSQKLHVD